MTVFLRVFGPSDLDSSSARSVAGLVLCGAEAGGAGGYLCGIRLNQLIQIFNSAIKSLNTDKKIPQKFGVSAGYEFQRHSIVVVDLFNLCPNTLTDLFR